MDAAGTAKANAMIEEGLSVIDDIVDLYEDEGIKTLCQNVRKPAGLIPDPNWVAPNPNPGAAVAPMVPRPGQHVPALCEQRLNMASYGATIYQAIGRPIETANLTRQRLREFKKHKEMVKNHKEPLTLPELTKAFTVAKFLDQFPSHLRELHGVNDVALTYIIRDTVVVPGVLPILLPLKTWSGSSTSMMEELIDYSPHNGPAYESDNARVYALLSSALSGTTSMA